jgi:hypothetical protein
MRAGREETIGRLVAAIMAVVTVIGTSPITLAEASASCSCHERSCCAKPSLDTTHPGVAPVRCNCCVKPDAPLPERPREPIGTTRPPQSPLDALSAESVFISAFDLPVGSIASHHERWTQAITTRQRLATLCVLRR